MKTLARRDNKSQSLGVSMDTAAWPLGVNEISRPGGSLIRGRHRDEGGGTRGWGTVL